MKGRIKEDDSSVPQKDGDYIYWRAFEVGAQYRKWYRRPAAAKDEDGEDQLILDEPALAEGHDYFRLGALSVSPDGRYLAYAIDNNGSERFEARRSEEHTSELQSLMRISYAVFCLKKKNQNKIVTRHQI